jgi:glycosyltransferase involved in cell wall biosynthesis
VRDLGPVDERDLPGLVAGALCVVCPSRAEGFGLPALEAMASGVPVVAAARGSLPEVAGDAGLLVEPTPEGLAGGLRRVLGDASLRAELARAGRERATALTWRRTATATLAVHEAVVKRQQRQAIRAAA